MNNLGQADHFAKARFQSDDGFGLSPIFVDAKPVQTEWHEVRKSSRMESFIPFYDFMDVVELDSYEL